MNAIEYRETKLEALIAVLGSIVFHILVFSLILLWILFTGFTIADSLSEKREKKKDQVVQLSPEYFKRPNPDTEKKQRYAKTNPLIEETVVKDADLIGEKSTLAASETVLNEGPKDLPSQITREEEKNELPNTFKSNFVDADVKQPPAPESEESKSQALEKAQQSEEVVDTTEEGKDQEKTEPAEALPKQKELLQAQTPVEIPNKESKEKRLKEPEEDVKEDLISKKSLGKSKSEQGLPKPKTKTQSSTPGFQTSQKKTRIIGSLSRDGASSLKVQRTALGRYYSEISKIIERKWQANCLQYREHIQPGVISMQFYVDAEGNVSNPRPHDVVSTSQIQVGFTMKAIRSSTLPPMPAAARKELGEEKLELIYNFYF